MLPAEKRPDAAAKPSCAVRSQLPRRPQCSTELLPKADAGPMRPVLPGGTPIRARVANRSDRHLVRSSPTHPPARSSRFEARKGEW
jgi:hypothetical protein